MYPRVENATGANAPEPQRPEWPQAWERLIAAAEAITPLFDPEGVYTRVPYRAVVALREALAPFQREHKKEAPE